MAVFERYLRVDLVPFALTEYGFLLHFRKIALFESLRSIVYLSMSFILGSWHSLI